MHGSSNQDSAKEEIKKFFGEVEFAPSGLLKEKEEGGEEGRAAGEEEGGAGEQGTTGV